MYILSLLRLPPTPLPHPRVPSQVSPRVIQQLPTSYLFYTWQWIYVNATLLTCLLFLPLLCPQVHFLHLHLYFCPSNSFSSTIVIFTGIKQEAKPKTQ